MGIFRGHYIEVKEAQIVYDGDYLRGDLVVRTVANGFDNTRKFDYPDDSNGEGTFVQGFPEDKIEELARYIRFQIRRDLLTIHKFHPSDLKKLGIPLIQTNN